MLQKTTLEFFVFFFLVSLTQSIHFLSNSVVKCLFPVLLNIMREIKLTLLLPIQVIGLSRILIHFDLFMSFQRI